MDINSSGTGGAEDGNLKMSRDESEVADDMANDTRANHSKYDKGHKLGITTSGPVASKQNGNDDSSFKKSSGGEETAFQTPLKVQTDFSISKESKLDENGKRIRYDSYGNRITTSIGTFSVANRKNLIKNKKMIAQSATSDTGGAETPLKSEESKK